jgi:hypothetical protein
MQRWEYKVVSFQNGRYTETLNEYGRDGWELISVASDVRGVVPAEPESGMPMPRAFGRLEDAAAKLNKLGGGGEAEAPEPTTSTTLLWVLRRPLTDDY